MRIRTSALCAVLAVVSISVAPAGAVVGGIEVQVINDGEPIPGASISLFDGEAKVAEEEADAAGVVRLPVEEGEYSLRVESGGEVTSRTVTVQDGRLDTYRASSGVVEQEETPIPASHVPADASAAGGYGLAYRVESGLVTIEIQTPQGIVFVSAPERVESETTVSWGVTPWPTGDSKTKQEKNRKKMGRYEVTVGDAEVEVGSTEQFAVTSAPQAKVTLSRDGKTLVSGTIPFRVVAAAGQGTDETVRPVSEAVLAGGAQTFAGPFDGDAGTTRIVVGGEPVRVVAESTIGASIYTPAALGSTQVTIAEGGESHETSFRNLGLEISVDQTHLKRGQQTHCRVRVTGLEGATERVVLTLVNRTPGIVTLHPSNARILAITPDLVGEGGVYQLDCTLTGVSLGTGEISSTVVPIAGSTGAGR